MDYSQTVALRFSAGQEVIDGYVAQFEGLAIQQGTADDIDIKTGWERVGDGNVKNVPVDYTVYVIISHERKVCTVSISKARNNIIFFADELIM